MTSPNGLHKLPSADLELNIKMPRWHVTEEKNAKAYLTTW